MILYNSGKESVDILTPKGYLTLTRTVLRPRDPEDIARLYELTGKKSVVPLDIAMGIDDLPFKITRSAMLEIAKHAINADSYKQLSESYKQERRTEISSDQIRLVTDFIGELVVSQDKQRARYAYSSLEKDKKGRKKSAKTGGILVLMMDGAYIELVKQDGGWKEVKSALCYNLKDVHYWMNSKGEIKHKILKRDYVSLIGSADDFAEYFAALFRRNGGHKLQEVVVIGDGADWITGIIEKVCPWAVHILDLAHLKEKVGLFGKRVISDEGKASKWIDEVCEMLEKGEWEKVLQLPEVQAHKDDKTTGGIVNLHLYISNRIGQLDYPEYVRKGYPVGSGAMESANRYLPQRRLKLPGMRWKKRSAQGILALRARLKAGKWSEVEKIVENHRF